MDEMIISTADNRCCRAVLAGSLADMIDRVTHARRQALPARATSGAGSPKSARWLAPAGHRGGCASCPKVGVVLDLTDRVRARSGGDASERG